MSGEQARILLPGEPGYDAAPAACPHLLTAAVAPCTRQA